MWLKYPTVALIVMSVYEVALNLTHILGTWFPETD